MIGHRGSLMIPQSEHVYPSCVVVFCFLALLLLPSMTAWSHTQASLETQDWGRTTNNNLSWELNNNHSHDKLISSSFPDVSVHCYNSDFITTMSPDKNRTNNKSSAGILPIHVCKDGSDREREATESFSNAEGDAPLARYVLASHKVLADRCCDVPIRIFLWNPVDRQVLAYVNKYCVFVRLNRLVTIFNKSPSPILNPSNNFAQNPPGSFLYIPANRRTDQWHNLLGGGTTTV